MREPHLEVPQVLRVLRHDLPNGLAVLAVRPGEGAEGLVVGFGEGAARAEVLVEVAQDEEAIVVEELEEHPRTWESGVTGGEFRVIVGEIGVLREEGGCDGEAEEAFEE